MYYKNGQVFNSQQAIRNDMKDTSLPSFLTEAMIAELGYLTVVDGIKPIPSAVQYVMEDTISLVAGVPTQVWNVVDMFADTAEYTGMDGIIVPARTKAEHEADYIAMQAKALVPQVVTPRQARLALLQVGLLDEVDLATKANKAHEVYWEYSLEVKRDDILLIELATVLSMTEAQLDDLFILASTL